MYSPIYQSHRMQKQATCRYISNQTYPSTLSLLATAILMYPIHISRSWISREVGVGGFICVIYAKRRQYIKASLLPTFIYLQNIPACMNISPKSLMLSLCLMDIWNMYVDPLNTEYFDSVSLNEIRCALFGH